MVELDSNDLDHFVEFHTGEGMVRKMSTWERFKTKDKLLLVLLVMAGLTAAAAIFILLTPVFAFLLNLFDLYIEGWAQANTWLLDGERGLGVALVLGFISILFLLLARWRYLNLRSAYVEAGCPQCHEQELIRIRRYRRDRILGFFGMPIRRYACRNCTWQGVRLAKYSHKPAAVGEDHTTEPFSEDLVLLAEDHEEIVVRGEDITVIEADLQEVN